MKNPVEETGALSTGMRETIQFALQNNYKHHDSIIVDAPLSKVGIKQANNLRVRLELHESLRKEQKLKYDNQLQTVATHLKDAMRAIQSDITEKPNVEVCKAPGVSVAHATLRLALGDVQQFMTDFTPSMNTKLTLEEKAKRRLPFDSENIMDELNNPKDSV
eukprot:UN25842